MFTKFKSAHVWAWIARLARSPAAPTAECEPGVLTFYHPVLEPIGESVNAWRLRNECDRDFAFRIAVAIAERLNQLDADLDRVINYDKR
jgi:hypothetical protein